MNKENETWAVMLSNKERAILWALACWFDKPVTSVLKQKLYLKGNEGIAAKYDDALMTRMIEMGEWLRKRRDRLEELEAVAK